MTTRFSDRRRPAKEPVQAVDREAALTITHALIQTNQITQVDDALRVYHEVMEACKPPRKTSAAD